MPARAWFRLRTHAVLVLAMLLLLVAFLGLYAVTGARRQVREADELLGSDLRAARALREVESARAEGVRASEKFRVTGDDAYREMRERKRAEVAQAIDRLRTTADLSGDAEASFELSQLALPVGGKTGSAAAFAKALSGLDRKLEARREARLGRLRAAARDLGRILVLAFLTALGVTSWLALMLYLAVLKPIESIKTAAGRIREGELSYRVESFRGFSELTELSREFNLMAAKLEELDGMKSDFLSTVSHELKTPLTAIKEGLSLLAEKKGQLSPVAIERAVEVSSRAAKRLEHMIQNLLNHARMESGFYHFDERPKDLVAVVEGAIQGVRPIAERKSHQIELRLSSPALSDGAEARHAAFSTEGITHAVENLLLNAIKYGDQAHPIVVGVSRLGSSPVAYLEVRVTNRGRGLLPAEIQHVFDRFFRASNAEGQKGVGLGLSVVKRIIEAHHGTLSAESADSVTTFSFRIPQLMACLAMLLSFGAGCAGRHVAAAAAPPAKMEQGQAFRLFHRGLDLLNPGNAAYDPEKGRACLEIALRSGTLKSVELPAATALELVRSTRAAVERSHALEQQLEVLKEIDLRKEGEL